MASSDPHHPPAVEICEVGPRDGLQNLARRFSVPEKVTLIDRLARTGVPRIEVGSFINPKRVPQMADIEEVIERIDVPGGVRLAGLAMNERGVARAVAAKLDEVRFVIVASETLSHRNQGTSVDESMSTLAAIAPIVRESGCRLTAAIAVAFGCPFEGEIDASRVIDLAGRSIAAGADEIMFADTIGAGVPLQVSNLCAQFTAIADGRRFGFHFHNTRSTGYANAIAAVNGGATILDSSIGGIGGCPFAPNATGNIATEDLFYLLRQSGIETGLDGARLIETVQWLRTLIPREISGHLADAGFFPEIVRPESSDQEVRSA